MQAHLFCKLHKVPSMRCIRRRKEISNEEDYQDQLNGGSNGVVLVAGLDVPDQHGRTRDFLECASNLVHRTNHKFLSILELHLVDRRFVANERRAKAAFAGV